MNTITCHHCHVDVLVDSASTVSLHRTSEGTVGYVRCPLGHLNVVRFHQTRVALPNARMPETCATC
jgi:hypothetical protein